MEAGTAIIEAMKRKYLTAYEASEKYGLSTSYLRILCIKGRLKAESVKITKTKTLWLISESSLKAFLKTKRSPGRPKK